ncbi:copper chaperone PCu(A)C [Tianweitania sediminis]|uniref:Copper chaperone PCu(A)C n=1 Tax=Tianweitania sediminis TaxID=1502156 RepID=A0A8J7ULN3_9HYPH|nr:copper chaperone PCu(A)C [Tianweitania sediminis]MBP0441120.1 copper chaperone PCu(A)C [Tianweitania sediminis]
MFLNRTARHLAGFIFAVSLTTVSIATAHEYKAGSLEIGHPWSRATLPGAKVAAGYLTIHNSGTEPDRLISVKSELSEKGEIHEMAVNATTGVMTMRPLAEGIMIEPGATVALEPGGYHLMFVGLKAPAEEDKRFKGTLTFEKAGAVEVDFAVDAAGAKPAESAGHDGGASGHDHGAAN